MRHEQMFMTRYLSLFPSCGGQNDEDQQIDFTIYKGKEKGIGENPMQTGLMVANEKWESLFFQK